ncbi:MAG TPA: antitoxin Xre/MbcA/ParS toxin-binding domain-containing protein [Gemmatimonadales bacterium]
MNVPHVARLLGGEKTLGRRVRTLDDLRRLVEAGLPIEALTRVVAHVSEPSDAGALRYRIVPRATLHRRKTQLSLEESERLERLARVAAIAEDVWEDDDKAREFLGSPQPQLGDRRPLDLAHTELGARQVEELLMKLEYGLPA